MLPAEEKPHEIGRADRLDFRAEPIDRVAVNPRQQPPVAPFDLGSGPRTTPFERAAHGHAVGFEREKRRVGVGLRDRERLRETSRGRWTGEAETSAQQLDDRLIECPRARGSRRWRLNRRLQHDVVVNRTQFRKPFCCNPEMRIADCGLRTAD